MRDRKQYHKEYYAREDIKDRRKQYLKKYAAENKDKLKEYKRKYYLENKDRTEQSRKEYRHRTKHQESCRKVTHKLRRKNLIGNISKLYQKEILKIYRARKEGQHVDHIIPICHEQVCGLHVPWNLQIIDASLNMSKNNRVDLESESHKLSLSLKDLT